MSHNVFFTSLRPLIFKMSVMTFGAFLYFFDSCPIVLPQVISLNDLFSVEVQMVSIVMDLTYLVSSLTSVEFSSSKLEEYWSFQISAKELVVAQLDE
eukprot:m.72005 g.72005  ORF g.72005 m.72005 type:complete len:97 (+) comp12295_c1_seq1:3354-3644(+)